MQVTMSRVCEEGASNAVRLENVLHFHQKFRQSIRWDRDVFYKRQRSRRTTQAIQSRNHPSTQFPNEVAFGVVYNDAGVLSRWSAPNDALNE